MSVTAAGRGLRLEAHLVVAEEHDAELREKLAGAIERAVLEVATAGIEGLVYIEAEPAPAPDTEGDA